MNSIGISLGWNCHPATYGVQNNLREIKINGYQTCPFDEMITNLPGVIECIEDDFKYFLDENYLKLIPCSFNSGGLKKGEILLYNTKYNFIFNHESPGHANLYITQQWGGGIDHYIKNNFQKFKERYLKRINNFREYLNNKHEVNFLISRYNNNFSLLEQTLNNVYPNLKYNITHITPPENERMIYEHYKLMGLNENTIYNELKNDIKVIISKYNEDVSWVEQLKYPYIIYNKGKYDDQYINIPNNGREGETYLRYILDNYDSLPEVLIFLQGNPFEHYKNTIYTINNINVINTTQIIGLSDWIETETPDENGFFFQENTGIKDTLPLLGIEWNISPISFYTGAQYIVPKSFILNKTKQWWQNCYNVYNNNSRSPWIFERIWAHIFYAYEI